MFNLPNFNSIKLFLEVILEHLLSLRITIHSKGRLKVSLARDYSGKRDFSASIVLAAWESNVTWYVPHVWPHNFTNILSVVPTSVHICGPLLHDYKTLLDNNVASELSAFPAKTLSTRKMKR